MTSAAWGGIGIVFVFERSAIEQQSVAFLAVQGGELVHQPAAHPGERVLRLLAGLRQFHPRCLPPARGLECHRKSHLERGRGA